ncbi:unnamed protein product [Symbiodinium natans]|uniref:Uncharacterized protein n=1 Tax=Symbiodinium natans TaxID=878477 RepID=A0A812TM91_9DINO|nr:unnamed protein product [Symbiodinium natans]
MAGMSGVRLRGLQAAAHLNGHLAVCKGFDEEKGRWLVQLENGEEKAIKNDNILQVLEPGTCISLKNGEVLHITIGRVSVLNQMEDEVREALLSDMDQFSMTHELRAELNCPDGWPQFSVVLTGGAKEVAAAHKALPAVLKEYGLEIPGPSAAAAAAPAEAEEGKDEKEEKAEETVEVEGLVMKSMERRERPSRKR